MIEAMQRLSADWPERYQPEKADMAFDARSLRDWVAHLPMANVVATSRQLFDALAAMNRLLLDPQLRLDALEFLRPHVAQVVGGLERQLAVESLPLPPAKLQLVRQAQDFEAALRLGYVQVLRDFLGAQGKIPFLKTRAVTLAALRALQHGAAVLTKAYLAYQAPPRGAWQMLHDVHAVACLARCDERVQADALLGDAELTPRLAYVQALLLELCNPYRFTQRELGELALLTLAWAPLCRLRRDLDGDSVFAVRSESDCGVGHVPEDREAGAAGRLGLDIATLRHDIEATLGMLPPGVDTAVFRLRGGAQVQAPVAFVERVLRSWRGGERGHARLSAGHSLEVVVGLHALHHALAGGEDFEAFLRRVRGQAISLGEGEAAAAWTAGFASGAPRPPLQRARVLDQSLGGYRLLWESAETLRAKVGEVVGLATPAPEDEPRDWMVGLIRWIRSDSDGSATAGVELLARRALPVGLASLDDEARPARPALRGVLLHDEDGAGQFAVLAPQLFDRASRQVELTRPADPYDWEGSARVQRLDVRAVDDACGSYQRVMIGASLPLAGLPDDATPLPLASTGT